MYRLLAVFTLLTACAQDPADIVVPARPQALTQAEIQFAQSTLNALQSPSFAQNREFCGLIGVDDNGQFAATPPVRGAKASCLPPLPARVGHLTVLASYHTHGAFTPEFETEVPSYDDLRTDIEDGIDGYVSTPGGRFWFVDARAREVRLICGPGCMLADSRFVPDPDFPVDTHYTLQELANDF
ncbi:MAG: DUF4329 domain-containing protein [Rhodobacteraceae bacterium]|nr:DUF4329 domain-containing protein [Paracoccaceae bacterium]